MNLLIKGLTIPKNIESYSLTVNVFPDVTYYRIMFGANSLYSGKCEIFIMPEKHSRLIDADKLMKVIEENDYTLRSCLNTVDRGMFTIGIKQAIDESPTIIEAEQGDG